MQGEIGSDHSAVAWGTPSVASSDDGAPPRRPPHSFCSPGEALHIAKVYLLQWHGDGQLPFASLIRRQPHADSIVRQAEDCLRQQLREPHAVAAVVAKCGIPERSLKRRFTAATGSTAIGYVQNLRVEEAKRLLETADTYSDDIAAAVGYE